MANRRKLTSRAGARGVTGFARKWGIVIGFSVLSYFIGFYHGSISLSVPSHSSNGVISDINPTSADGIDTVKQKFVSPDNQNPSPNVKPPQKTPSQTLRKDVVVGMAKGIAPKPLAIFVASLRKFSDCDMVLWMDEKSTKDPNTERIISKYRVEVRIFREENLNTYAQKWHPSSYRWVLMNDFLKKEGLKRSYRGVLMADVRDTAFQSNPFSILDEQGSVFFASSEDKDIPTRRIRDCQWNKNWIKDCHTSEILSKVSENPIICSGISIATLTEAQIYTQKMSDKLESKHGRKCERNGVDQGMHNVLVWTNEIPNLKITTQESGLIANMQSGLMLEKEYVDWNVDDDKECEMFETDDTGYDLFVRRCDIGLSGGATSKGDCCRACMNWENCKGFAFILDTGKCFMKDCANPNGEKRRISGGGSSGWMKLP
ncbi:hypothetical protein AAMO2058_001142800 [Amorphochlora amoebiformis]